MKVLHLRWDLHASFKVKRSRLPARPINADTSPFLCWQSLITVICRWSAFLQSSWTDSRPLSTQQLVWSVMLWRQITLHLCWKTYTGYESRKGSSTSYVSLRSSVNIVWHHHTCPTTSTSHSNGAQTTSEIIEFASARRTSY